LHALEWSATGSLMLEILSRFNAANPVASCMRLASLRMTGGGYVRWSGEEGGSDHGEPSHLDIVLDTCPGLPYDAGERARQANPACWKDRP
jgi:hypothetical protein